jgi:hypothetical protein
VDLESPRVDVAGITVDYRLTLTLDEGWVTQDVAAALPLFGTKVVSAVAFTSGTLRMVFENGTHLTCSTDAAFEAWRITGPGGWRFVSLPGGDLGVWSASAVNENLQVRSAEH